MVFYRVSVMGSIGRERLVKSESSMTTGRAQVRSVVAGKALPSSKWARAVGWYRVRGLGGLLGF